MGRGPAQLGGTEGRRVMGLWLCQWQGTSALGHVWSGPLGKGCVPLDREGDPPGRGGVPLGRGGFPQRPAMTLLLAVDDVFLLSPGVLLSSSRKCRGFSPGPRARPPWHFWEPPPHMLRKQECALPCPRPRLAWPQVPHEPSLTRLPWGQGQRGDASFLEEVPWASGGQAEGRLVG